MKKTHMIGAALSAGFLAGCSTAQIAVPPSLAATAKPLEITGMGFGERGSFRVGQSQGSFKRQALSARDREWYGPGEIESFFGESSFNAAGADFDGLVSADCSHVEVERDLGSLSITELPFNYRCRFFRDGQPIDAQLVLHSAPRAVGPLMGETRIGYMQVGGRTLGLEPIHHSAGLAIPTAEPLGYRFVENGRDVGAVDLNGERKTVYAPFNGPDREAVLMGSLALSVLWRN